MTLNDEKNPKGAGRKIYSLKVVSTFSRILI